VDLTFRTDVLRSANPHRRFRYRLGIGVQADEVHSQFWKLLNDGAIVSEIPPVRPLREIVERLDTTQREQWPTRIVDIRHSKRNSLIRHDVAMKVEADPHMLTQAVYAIQRSGVICAGHNQQPAV